MSDSIPQDAPPRRYMDVNLMLHLGALSEKVSKKYPQDWLSDVELLVLSVFSGKSEEKNLVLFAYRYGTIIKPEYEVFIKDSGAFNFLTDSLQQKQQTDYDIFGYIVEVIGYDGDILKGNIFEIGSYAEYAEHIRNRALPRNSEITELLRQERAKRMLLPIGNTGEFFENMTVKLTTVKPQTLAEKFRAAYRKVKSQDTKNNISKSLHGRKGVNRGRNK